MPNDFNGPVRQILHCSEMKQELGVERIEPILSAKIDVRNTIEYKYDVKFEKHTIYYLALDFLERVCFETDIDNYFSVILLCMYFDGMEKQYLYRKRRWILY